jgi:hypothetical protein
MGTEGRRLPADELARVVARRHRRGWDASEDEETARGVSLAMERPADARPRDIATLQRLAGNQAVVQLAAQTASPGAQVEEEVNPPPGPYTGPRKRNDKMDWFEDHQNIFGPGIFREYGPYPELWAPLDWLVEAYWVRNVGNEAGIRLDTADKRVAAWVIIERFNSAKAAAIRQEKPGKKRDGILLDAIWGEFAKQYRFAHDRCQADARHSRFRHFHEWAAVRFDKVQPPYAYHAKG